MNEQGFSFYQHVLWSSTTFTLNRKLFSSVLFNQIKISLTRATCFDRLNHLTICFLVYVSSKPLPCPPVGRGWRTPPPLRLWFWIRMTTNPFSLRGSLLAQSLSSLSQVRLIHELTPITLYIISHTSLFLIFHVIYDILRVILRLIFNFMIKFPSQQCLFY